MDKGTFPSWGAASAAGPPPPWGWAIWPWGWTATWTSCRPWPICWRCCTMAGAAAPKPASPSRTPFQSKPPPSSAGFWIKPAFCKPVRVLRVTASSDSSFSGGSPMRWPISWSNL